MDWPHAAMVMLTGKSALKTKQQLYLEVANSNITILILADQAHTATHDGVMMV